MTNKDLWFIQISADWGWLRRLIFGASWPLCFLMSNYGGELESTAGDAEERLPDAGAVPAASTEFTPTPQMLEIAEAARDKSTMTADELFAAMTSDLERRKELVLMALDLCYNWDAVVEAANAEYAAALERGVDGLTDNEKQEALLNWMLKQGEGDD